MAVIVTALDGFALNTAAGYGAGWPQGAREPVTVEIASTPRRGFYGRAGDVTVPAREFALLVYPNQSAPASVGSGAVWRATVEGRFRPRRSGAPVTLSATWHDGTAVEMAVRIVARQRITTADTGEPWSIAYQLTLRADIPIWSAVTPSSSSAAVITNAGNIDVYPSVALTTTATQTWRRCTVTGAGLTNGLQAYPVRLDLAASPTPATVLVFVNGAPATFYLDASRLWTLVDTHPDGVTATTIDVVYGAGISNPRAQRLDMGGLNPTTSTNSLWVYRSFSARVNQGYAGQWRPELLGRQTFEQPFSFGLADSGGTAATVTYSSNQRDYDSDADALVVDVPSGVSILYNATRVTSATLVNLQWAVRSRLANDVTWQTVATGRAAGTTTSTDISSVANAIQLALVTETYLASGGGTANNPAGSVTFNVYSGIAYMRILLAQPPAVTINPAQTLDWHNGTLRLGNGPGVTFSRFMVPSGTLTIDAQAGAISSSVPDAPMFGGVSFDDPGVMLELAPGDNTLTAPPGSTATVSWRAGYSP